MMMMLMKKMVSAAVVGFLHAAVELRHLEQAKPSISRVKQKHIDITFPAAAVDPPTSRPCLQRCMPAFAAVI